jgi:hypothetical protein
VTKTRPAAPDVYERLAEAEETLRAIRNGEVDALVVRGDSDAAHVFTLSGLQAVLQAAAVKATGTKDADATAGPGKPPRQSREPPGSRP